MRAGRLLAIFVWFAATAAAQRYGNLQGRVLDTTAGGIADAQVTVVNEESGFRREVQSEPGGGYSVASLRPGSYKVSVRKEGFIPVVRFGVKLVVSALTRVDFVLDVGTHTESITVEGKPATSERQDAATGSTVTHEQIETLPLNGAGLLSLLEMTAGTNVTPATRGEAGQFSATGQRPNTNYFTVDGVSANTGVAAGGLPAQSTGGTLPALSAFGSMDSLISLDSVDEMRVTTSSSGAEMGRLPGANVAIQSRSGTNEFHSTSLFRLRNELVSANNWFANQAGYGPLPLRLLDFNQTFGGPLKRNRTYFLLSFEAMSLRQPYAWRQPVPSLDSRNSAADWAQPVLNLFPAPTSPGLLASGIGEWFGRSDRPGGLFTGSLRFDQALGTRATFFARYNDSPSNSDFGTLSINHLDLRSRSLTLGLNSRPTSNWVLDTRANESQSSAHSNWTDPGAVGCPLQALTDYFYRDPSPCDYLVRFSVGGLNPLISGHEGDRRQRQFQFVQTASLRRQSNTLGVGLDYRRVVGIRRDPTGTLGLYVDDLAALVTGKNLWKSNADAQNSSVNIHELSLWLQDTWHVTSRLTLSAGLRWEYSPPPPPVDGIYFLNPETNTIFSNQNPQQELTLWPVSHRNFAPRAGLVVRLTGDGKTILRAGGGLYYDSSLSIASDSLNGGPLSVSSFESPRGGFVSFNLTYGFMRNLVLPTVRQWNVTLERSLGEHDVLSLSYVGAVGRDLIVRGVGGPGSSATSYTALTTNNGRSNYQALQLQYHRRLTSGLQAQASYTWSHSIDNDSGDSYLLWAAPGFSDRGSSDFDQRQLFTAAATYELHPRGTAFPARALRRWSMDAIFHARTGFPVSVLDSEQYLGITLVNAFRPDLVYGQPLWLKDPEVGGGRRLNPAAFDPAPTALQGTLGRNSITGFGMSQVDFALRREFRLSERRRLQFRLESFNLLNHPNFADPVKYLNSPVFGNSTSMLNLMLGSGSPGSGLAPILQTGGARSIQGSMRFQF